ncbi:hypothetical protein IHN57_16040, partial [Deinococcus sp. 6GRE01]|nr:hypothetical protein [Deinococcus sp. 6GRE01]
ARMILEGHAVRVGVAAAQGVPDGMTLDTRPLEPPPPGTKRRRVTRSWRPA